MKDRVLKIHDNILEHLMITSICLSALVTALCFILPVKRMDLVPHILTYSSCNLALIGFVFSILLGVRGGEIHKLLIDRYANNLKKTYRIIYRITVASAVCALLSLLILGLTFPWKWVKIGMAFILCSTFLYMVLGTILIFGVLINLLINETTKYDRDSSL